MTKAALRHMTDKSQLYTIGYSPHTLKGFVDLLKRFQVTALADVRSKPYSAYRPEFNHKNLKKILPEQGIDHIFLGREMGARYEDQSVYVQGRADYELISRHELFKQGLQRLRQEVKQHTLVLMCAEKEPLHCHRTILISRHLKNEVQIQHILADATVESHQDTEQRLLALYDLIRPELPGLEQSRQARLDKAYLKQGRKIAWRAY
jgi:uncharacterized protein (DUF488 family)